MKYSRVILLVGVAFFQIAFTEATEAVTSAVSKATEASKGVTNAVQDSAKQAQAAGEKAVDVATTSAAGAQKMVEDQTSALTGMVDPSALTSVMNPSALAGTFSPLTTMFTDSVGSILDATEAGASDATKAVTTGLGAMGDSFGLIPVFGPMMKPAMAIPNTLFQLPPSIMSPLFGMFRQAMGNQNPNRYKPELGKQGSTFPGMKAITDATSGLTSMMPKAT